jgi:hypothetical protein
MHGAINTFLAFFAPIQAGEAYSRLLWLYAGLWWVVALIGLYQISANPLPRREVEQLESA